MLSDAEWGQVAAAIMDRTGLPPGDGELGVRWVAVRAADSYDRAARAQYGRIPRRTPAGNQLRAAARLMAMFGDINGGVTLATAALIANLAALVVAVAELREAQQYAAQAAAARAAVSQLHAVNAQARPPAPPASQVQTPQRSRPATAADVARRGFPGPALPGQVLPADPGLLPPRSRGRPLPPNGLDRAGDAHRRAAPCGSSHQLCPANPRSRRPQLKVARAVRH
jgi:hypothetical protein